MRKSTSEWCLAASAAMWQGRTLKRRGTGTTFRICVENRRRREMAKRKKITVQVSRMVRKTITVEVEPLFDEIYPVLAPLIRDGRRRLGLTQQTFSMQI